MLRIRRWMFRQAFNTLWTRTPQRPVAKMIRTAVPLGCLALESREQTGNLVNGLAAAVFGGGLVEPNQAMYVLMGDFLWVQQTPQGFGSGVANTPATASNPWELPPVAAPDGSVFVRDDAGSTSNVNLSSVEFSASPGSWDALEAAAEGRGGDTPVSIQSPSTPAFRAEEALIVQQGLPSSGSAVSPSYGMADSQPNSPFPSYVGIAPPVHRAPQYDAGGQGSDRSGPSPGSPVPGLTSGIPANLLPNSTAGASKTVSPQIPTPPLPVGELQGGLPSGDGSKLTSYAGSAPGGMFGDGGDEGGDSIGGTDYWLTFPGNYYNNPIV